MTRDAFQKRRQIGTKMKAFLKSRNVPYEHVEDDFEHLKKLFDKEEKKLLREIEKAEAVQVAQILVEMHNAI